MKPKAPHIAWGRKRNRGKSKTSEAQKETGRDDDAKFERRLVQGYFDGFALNAAAEKEGEEMKMSILKTLTFQTVFVIGMVAVASYILYISLKFGLAFGRWPNQGFHKSEHPILYWFCVAVYSLFFAGSIFQLIYVIKADWILWNWQKPPN